MVETKLVTREVMLEGSPKGKEEESVGEGGQEHSECGLGNSWGDDRD